MNLSHHKAQKTRSENERTTVAPQSQPIPGLAVPLVVPRASPSNNLLQNQPQKSSPPFDLVFDPSKKIKLNRDTYTQQVSEVTEAPLRTLHGNQLDFFQRESFDPFTESFLPFLPHNTPVDLSHQIPVNQNQYYSNHGVGHRDMNMFLQSPTIRDMLKYQQLEQHLRQQQLINQYRAQHQFFDPSERHHLKPRDFPPPFAPVPRPDFLMPQVIETNQNFPLSLLRQQKEIFERNSPEEKQENELIIPELKSEEDLQLLKKSPSSEEQVVEQKKSQNNKAKPRAKRGKRTRQKSQDAFKRLSKVKQEVDESRKAESRRKNKWQVLVEQKLQEERAEAASLLPKEENKWQREDDRNVDYEYLLSVMITNDSGKIGRENSETNFVVLNRDTLSKEAKKSRKPRVGNKYQAPVADCQLGSQRKGPSLRNIPALHWNPDVVSENQLVDYIDSLRKALKCEQINTARALRLLKNKEFKKDKVLWNIRKNERYYSKVLMMKDEIGGPVDESADQNANMLI